MSPLGMWRMFFTNPLYHKPRGDFYIQKQKSVFIRLWAFRKRLLQISDERRAVVVFGVNTTQADDA